MKRKKRRKTEPAYTQLGVHLERYEAEAGVDVNFHLEHPELAFHDPDDDPLFEHITQLVLTGTATYPPDRAGESFELTIRGDDNLSTRVGLKLRDMQLKDENGVPQYREYRGQTLPVYRSVPGIASVSRAGKTAPWTAWITLAPRLVSDMLTLLSVGGRLHLAILERKQGRERWIRRLALQTRDPANE
jgi:hypothetical protein